MGAVEPGVRVKVVLVDDDPLVRSGLRLILGGSPQIVILGEGGDGRSGVDAAIALAPDVVLMDLHMPGLDGIAATAELLLRRPGVRVVVLTAFDSDDMVLGALRAGATGFLLKDSAPGDIIAGVLAAARDEPRFSPSILRRLVSNAVSAPSRTPKPRDITEREREVADLVVQGLSNAEIAAELYVGITTVKTHISALLGKYGVANRVQLAVVILSAEHSQ